MAMASAEKRQGGSLRPRNLSVPSYRPRHRGGSTLRVCLGVPGSGEGQGTWTGREAGHIARAGADVQSTAKRSGPKRLGVPPRSLTPCDHQRTPGQAEPVGFQ